MATKQNNGYIVFYVSEGVSIEGEEGYYYSTLTGVKESIKDSILSGINAEDIRVYALGERTPVTISIEVK